MKKRPSRVNLSFAAFKHKDATRACALSDETEGTSFRSPFARDRDRIMYSKPFRRLCHKTQVYLTTESNHAYDEHCRTRLTHTLEVAQIAKAISRSLNLNLDLTEAIAFGHDVGHAPFGHAGERQIDDFLNGLVPLPREVEDQLGDRDQYYKQFREYLARDFKHNYQSVRLLSLLEPYSPFERGVGLNLTFQTLSGILQHTKVSAISDSGRRAKYPEANHVSSENLLKERDCQSVEARVVAVADEIAQVVHDLCDAMKIGALSVEDLQSDYCPLRPIIEKCVKRVRTSKREVDFSQTAGRDELIAQFSSAFVHYFAVESSLSIERHVSSLGPEKATLKKLAKRVGTMPSPEDDFRALLSFKDDLIVNNFSVNRMDNRGRYIIRQLIKSYLADPRQLPDSVLSVFMEMKKSELRTRGKTALVAWFDQSSRRFGIPELRKEQKVEAISVIEKDAYGRGMRGARHELVRTLVPFFVCDADYLRTIADYISSMTDRFAEKECAALYD